MMDAMHCILTRRSHRRFLADPLPDALLNEIVEAGRAAPTGGNSQSFHFIVITNRQVMAQLSRLVTEAFARMEVCEGMYGSLVNSINRAKSGQYVFHYDPPALIIAANKRGYGNAMADCACALENMMLAANALDLGSCWINQLHWLDSYAGVAGEQPELETYLHSLGLGEDETVCGALSVGYVENVARNALPRKSTVTYVR